MTCLFVSNHFQHVNVEGPVLQQLRDAHRRRERDGQTIPRRRRRRGVTPRRLLRRRRQDRRQFFRQRVLGRVLLRRLGDPAAPRKLQHRGPVVVSGSRTEIASRDEAGSRSCRGRARRLARPHAGAAAAGCGLDRGQGGLLLRFRRLTTQDRFTVHPDGRFANEHVSLQRVLPLRRQTRERQQGGLLPRLGILIVAQAADGLRGLPGVAAALAVRAVGPGT